MQTSEIAPNPEELLRTFQQKYAQSGESGWGPRTRLSFGYFSPDDHYETVVAKLVREGCAWADVGCGRNIFPSNAPLARELAGRCSLVYGIDPDPNVRDNPFVTERFEGFVEDCTTPHRFDLITMRMVAEHIVDPGRSVRKLAELLKPGGQVVIYTPNRWAPVSMAASLIPDSLHHTFKRLLWDAEEKDTFPTVFRMNTRRALADWCGRSGLSEEYFAYLDDCRTFDGYRWLNYAELTLQRALRTVGIRYPENCLLGVYRRPTS